MMAWPCFVWLQLIFYPFQVLSNENLKQNFISIFSILQVIAAEGEQKASRALREASEVISESPSALQVGCVTFGKRTLRKSVGCPLSVSGLPDGKI